METRMEQGVSLMPCCQCGPLKLSICPCLRFSVAHTAFLWVENAVGGAAHPWKEVGFSSKGGDFVPLLRFYLGKNMELGSDQAVLSGNRYRPCPKS